jgi:DtxR family Mn-dependent transcriptional regulator
LWGRFLADHLGLTPAKADEVACEMEHVTPEMVADRLASFLGDPTTGPTGKPIPARSGPAPSTTVALEDVAAGERVTVARVSPDHGTFLSSQGIDTGVEISILGVGADGSVLVQGPTAPLHLATEVVAGVEVSR